MTHILHTLRFGTRLGMSVALCLLITLLTPASIVSAQMTGNQRLLFKNKINYFDYDESAACGPASIDGSVADGSGSAWAQAVTDSKTLAKMLNGAKYDRDAYTKFSYQFFVNKGLEPAAVAGMLGNFNQESNMNPAIQQGGQTTPTTPQNTRGFGIAQWTFTSRQAPLEKLAREAGVPVNTLAPQLAYTWYELNTSHKSSLDSLRAPKPTSYDGLSGSVLSSLTEAGWYAWIFHKQFEGSADSPSQIRERTDDADDILAAMNGGTGTGGQGSGDGAQCEDTAGLTGECQIYGPDGALQVGQMQGNAAILACARLFDPYGYLMGGAHGDPEAWMKGFEAQGGFKNKTFRQLVDCTSIEMLAIYLAFGVKLQFSTSTIHTVKELREIPMNQVQVGDLMWRDGHSEIAAVAGGKKTFGAHSARYPEKRQISDSSGGKYTKAYRYVGEGSAQQ